MDTRLIYYVEDSHIYLDECGQSITNIFREVSANMIYLFRGKKENMVVYGVMGDLIELSYLPF